MKFRKLWAMLICCVLMCALFTSCRKSELKAFYFAVREPAVTFDPTIAENGTARIIVRNCFEGLVYTDGEGIPSPGAAKSWRVSPDGLTYTFTLREDAKWHLTSNAQKELKDKLPENFDLSLKAEDFVFALQRGVDPAMGATDAYLLGNIAGAKEILEGKASPQTLGVRAISDNTLEIKLSKPQEDFFFLLTQPICMPCDPVFFDACGGRYGLLIKNSLSNGPFYLSFFDEKSYRITKNPDYVGEHTPKADVIRFYTVSDNKILFDNLKNSEYSGALMDEVTFSEFKPPKKMQVQALADVTRCFILNTQSTAFTQGELRTAFVKGTDGASLAKYAEKDPVFSPLPPAFSGNTQKGNKLYSPEEALNVLNSYLEKTGEKSVTVTLKCEKQFENYIKKQLQNWQSIFGTSYIINLEALTASELKRAVNSGDFELAFYPLTASSPIPRDFFSQFTSFSHRNVCGLNSEELDSAVSALQTAGKAESDGAMNSALSALENQGAVLPVWSENTYFICNENTQDVILLAGSDSIYFYNCDTKQ